MRIDSSATRDNKQDTTRPNTTLPRSDPYCARLFGSQEEAFVRYRLLVYNTPHQVQVTEGEQHKDEKEGWKMSGGASIAVGEKKETKRIGSADTECEDLTDNTNSCADGTIGDLPKL